MDYSTLRDWLLKQMMRTCAIGVGVDMKNFSTMPVHSSYEMPMQPQADEPNNDDEFESANEH